MSKVPLFDLGPENVAQEAAFVEAFRRVLRSNAFILGPEVSGFERHVERYLGRGHAVGLSSGSDALYVALRALGIGPGDEVITTPFSFVATAEAIVRCGATPVFADIEPSSFGLCPASTARMRTSTTRAVLTVSLYGHPGTVLELERYCHDEGLFLVEDACQSFGATIDNRPLGTIGKIGVYSFFPTKPLGGIGDGGLLVTSDEALTETAKRLRVHGVNALGKYSTLGGNFRLDALQAALLDVRLGHVDESRNARRTLVEHYRVKLAESPYVHAPVVPATSVESAWSLCTLRIPEHRDRVQSHLAQWGIEARVYYATLLSEQPSLSAVSRSDDLPVARAASREVLSIPCYPGLPPQDQKRVIDALLSFSPDP